MNSFVKINKEGKIVETANSKVLKLSTHIIVNPKEEDFRAAGFYPIINPDEVAPNEEGFYTEPCYKMNDTNDGIILYYKLLSNPEPQEEEHEREGEPTSELEDKTDTIEEV